MAIESTLTDRFQTTIPDAVRKALHLSRRDRIAYQVQYDGTVVLSRARAAGDDPVVGNFLDFLAEDAQRHPERLQGVDSQRVRYLQNLTAETSIDLDQPLSEDE